MNGAAPRCVVTWLLLGGVIAVACAASACVIGPRYTAPAVPVPATYSENGAPALTGDWKVAQPDDAASRGSWWTIFGDPHLNELEGRLNLTNQTVAAAAADVQVARALVRQARAQYFPAFTLNPSVTNTRTATANGRPDRPRLYGVLVAARSVMGGRSLGTREAYGGVGPLRRASK